MTISVLVIDDDRSVRDTLTDFLSTLGHTARTAGSASDGRAAVAEQVPDIALVDLRLPDGEGLALLNVFRAHEAEIGVIMLAGRSDIPAALHAMRNGASDFVERPVRLDSLEASLLRTTELLRARRELAELRSIAPSSSSARATGQASTMADAERRAIADALKSTGGNKLRAAKLLGIARSTLLEKLKRLDLVM
jgi:DNA-binding NtrC family response regulator